MYWSEHSIFKLNPTRIGSLLFLMWGILHIWVALEGAYQYANGGVSAQWAMLIGGIKAPYIAFQNASDNITLNVHSQLLLNFCLDVGGYGVLGIFVAWMLWYNPAPFCYFLGLVVIGVGDLAFTFSLLTPGIIALNIGTIGGPALWLLAAIITPFGIWPSQRVTRLHQ